MGIGEPRNDVVIGSSKREISKLPTRTVQARDLNRTMDGQDKAKDQAKSRAKDDNQHLDPTNRPGLASKTSHFTDILNGCVAWVAHRGDWDYATTILEENQGAARNVHGQEGRKHGWISINPGNKKGDLWQFYLDGVVREKWVTHDSSSPVEFDASRSSPLLAQAPRGNRAWGRGGTRIHGGSRPRTN
ncbi:hypothetical protein BO82DRAFT_49171 [Aspergillus uvarum CBS 121591]|uniref:Uncharacterized protein n=1 Tax=Aspergillus uvarum CBS 121591 TaxID=1448315 RepID=A0A319CFA0_9EURO|nr:hypothetical protein BO82DRAFT_49171 [Aspergillus uvarum CBS 121591]PYH82979.1 hypothetical protein BO82DRAFT_49171 [Aspergillus uvarum CBS 121591]